MEDAKTAYSDACGSLIVTADGRMFAILADNARQLNDPPGSLFNRMMAYTGRYRIQGDDAFVVEVDVSWHPSWLGTEQTRYFKIERNMLWIISAPQQRPKHPGRTIRGIITWRRE